MKVVAVCTDDTAALPRYSWYRVTDSSSGVSQLNEMELDVFLTATSDRGAVLATVCTVVTVVTGAVQLSARACRSIRAVIVVPGAFPAAALVIEVCTQ